MSKFADYAADIFTKYQLFKNQISDPALLVYAGEIGQLRSEINMIRIFSLSRHLDEFHR